jgi:type VI secretion system protein ImpM
MEIGASPGFFGKLPANGDFVSRRLPRNFIDPWDQWLQAAIASSREQLGGAWLDDYLTSPIWRFALSAEVAGPLPCSGIMMPSVDKAGRYFPLTLATFLPTSVNLFQIAGISQTWYEAAEAVALSVLEEDPPDMELLDSQIIALGLLVSTGVGESGNTPPDSGEAHLKSWHVSMQSVTGLMDALPVMVKRLAELRFGTYSLWWSAGSEQIEPAILMCEGLPPATGYSAMLGGGWQKYGWDELPVLSTATGHDEGKSAESCS